MRYPLEGSVHRDSYCLGEPAAHMGDNATLRAGGADSQRKDDA